MNQIQTTPIDYTIFRDKDNNNLEIGLSNSTKLDSIFVENYTISTIAKELIVPDYMGSNYSVELEFSAYQVNESVSFRYEELSQVFSVLDRIKICKQSIKSITKFDSINALWSKNGLSLGFFSTPEDWLKTKNYGPFIYYILKGKVNIRTDNISIIEKIEEQLLKAKDYIEKHYQLIGTTLLLDKEKKQLLSTLIEIVMMAVEPYIKILSKKFNQLTYIDDYDTREYGPFLNEIDKFIEKKLSFLPKESKPNAKIIIQNIIEKYALDPKNNIEYFNLNMTPLDYEIYCAKLFSQAGWITNTTKKIGDQGADVIIKFNELTGVVQCKLYNQAVGNGAVQEVIAAREFYKAQLAFVVSNANFTVSAKQLAASTNVVLAHHDEINTYSMKLGIGESQC